MLEVKSLAEDNLILRKMKKMKTIISVLAGIVFPILSFGQQSYADSLVLERQIHDKQFMADVLNDEERKIVREICYFNVDTNLIVPATLSLKKGKRFIMPMSQERIVYYRSVGTLKFKINDSVCTLQLYKNLSSTDKTFKNYYFLPFRDGTSGKTTYGGGKYMDIILSKDQLKAGNVILDFNTSYHPYCAYSSRYSCPIVEASNRISTEIEAGECYTLNDEAH